MEGAAAADGSLVDLRGRDLLPLPLGAGFDACLAASHGGGQRARRRRRADEWLRAGVATLNELGGEGRSVGHNDRLTAAQRTAVRQLAGMYGGVEHAAEGAMDRREVWRC